MKPLKFAVLLLTILIINSCTSKGENKITPVEETSKEIFLSLEAFGPRTLSSHELLLNFQDTLGNDLIKNWEENPLWDELPDVVNIRVKPELHNLEVIVYGDTLDYQKLGCAYWGLRLVSGKQLSERTGINGNYDYLLFRVDCQGEISFDEIFSEKITFRFTCPYLFGDNKAHDIVTWWKTRSLFIGTVEYSSIVCYLIEFNSKEITEINYVAYNIYSVATIILDK